MRLPQEWQKHHRIGAATDAARQRAVQLYPDLAPLFARKRDQHRADPLLLAATAGPFYQRKEVNCLGAQPA
jgi:hypothetical protein